MGRIKFLQCFLFFGIALFKSSYRYALQVSCFLMFSFFEPGAFAIFRKTASLGLDFLDKIENAPGENLKRVSCIKIALGAF